MPYNFIDNFILYLATNNSNCCLDLSNKQGIKLITENKFLSALDEVRTLIENNHNKQIQNKEINTAEELLSKELPPLKFIIKDMLIETGYGIISGRPKCGKSWLMLNLCIAIASGGKFLGKYDCEKSNVLYLALEDSERRMQNRLKTILSYEDPARRSQLDSLFIIYKIPRYNDGGKEQLKKYIAEHDIKVVIIDTQKRFTSLGRNSYDIDYEYKIGQELQSFALENNICLLSVLHNRKSKGEGSAIDEIAGTYGISAGADFWAVLNRGRHGSKLTFGGRDVPDKELLLSFDERGVWNAFGDDSEVNESQVRVKWEKIIINDEMRNPDVVQALMHEYECSQATAYNWIKQAVENKIIYYNKKYILIT
jgi:RecA-family ATPase